MRLLLLHVSGVVPGDAERGSQWIVFGVRMRARAVVPITRSWSMVPDAGLGIGLGVRLG